MIWLTWRQFRLQAAAVATVTIAFALVLAATGSRLADLATTYRDVFDHLTANDRHLFYAGIVVIAVAPVIIGVFWGAPMVARELEAGTHRLAWTQSVTRTRWLATKLGVTTLAAAAAVGLLTCAVTWWSQPLDGALSSTHGSLPSRLTPVSFAMRGIVPVGYAVFAVVLGATLGAVFRRSLPAMAVTLAVVTFVQIAVPAWIRPHLVPTAEQTVTFAREKLDGITIRDNGPGTATQLMVTIKGAAGSWVLSNQTVDAAGHATALPSWFSGCLPPPPSPGASNGPVRAQGPDKLDACFIRLNAEGYRQHVVYQPANHFWPLQWAELALYLVVSALLASCCFWWVRRRLS
ncbi:MAG TPA: ABC transporter permease subunit [Actinomycetes bacterium]|jgi:hypothetical protein|nr:ABC transporter permease subunit [Actinomycetes bacterium]